MILLAILGGLLVLPVIAGVIYLWFLYSHAKRGWCRPFTHQWNINRDISVPMWDMRAKGELWRCENCDKVRAL